MKVKIPFDLNTAPVMPAAENATLSPDTPPAPMAEDKNKKLITLPFIGIQLTRLQLGLAVVFVAGLVGVQILRNAPAPENTPARFVSHQTPEPEPVQPVVTTAAPLSSPDQDLYVWVQNNREGLKALDKRLRELTREVAALRAQQAAAASSLPLAPRPAAADVPSSTPAALKGATITSLYPGLAWVTWQGKTWALHPGDSLGSARVLRINTATREVITTAGILR